MTNREWINQMLDRAEEEVAKNGKLLAPIIDAVIDQQISYTFMRDCYVAYTDWLDSEKTED